MKKYLTSPWGALITHLAMHWALAGLLLSFLVLDLPAPVAAQAVPAVQTTSPLTISAASISASEVVALTNQLRQEVGVSSLSVNSKLMASAQMKAEDMASKGYFAHENAEGQRLAYWLSVVGYNYRYAGENLAEGFNTAAGAMNGWRNSASHYANIIKPEYAELGIGVASGIYQGQSVIFVVQHFGVTKALVIPVTEDTEVVVKPVFTSPVTEETVVEQESPVAVPAATDPVAVPAINQTPDSFVEQAAPAQVPALDLNLIPAARAATDEVAAEPAASQNTDDIGQALMVVVFLMVASGLYTEIESNRDYWQQLLTAAKL